MKAIRIAHIGRDRRQTANDAVRTMMVAAWLMNHGLRATHQCDDVNIKYGRDFLAEDREYEVVVLHSIFDTKDHTFIPEVLIRDGQISPLDRRDNWRKRLVSTKANYIFVFELGNPCCLNAWNISPIKGYKAIERDAVQRFGVFEKLPL